MKKETIISIALVTISVIIIIVGGIVINNSSGNGLTKKEETESYIKLIEDSITLPIGEEYDFNADIESFNFLLSFFRLPLILICSLTCFLKFLFFAFNSLILSL